MIMMIMMIIKARLSGFLYTQKTFNTLPLSLLGLFVHTSCDWATIYKHYIDTSFSKPPYVVLYIFSSLTFFYLP